MRDDLDEPRYEARSEDPRSSEELLAAAKRHAARNEALSREVLLGRHRGMRFGRRVFSLLPRGPRCKLCASPFSAPLGPVMRLIGKGPWPRNPAYCSGCFQEMIRRRAGAEIECSLLFADVRGSTGLAEHMSPMEFRDLMGKFLNAAAEIVISNEGIVDKFVGDEIVAIFIPAMSGVDHAANAITAARHLVAAAQDRGIPAGAGVNTGIAFVGAVGEGSYTEFTAMGDPVNVAARLAARADAGEVLATLDAAAAAGLNVETLVRRTLELKGKSETVEVVVVRSGLAAGSAGARA